MRSPWEPSSESWTRSHRVLGRGGTERGAENLWTDAACGRQPRRSTRGGQSDPRRRRDRTAGQPRRPPPARGRPAGPRHGPRPGLGSGPGGDRRRAGRRRPRSPGDARSRLCRASTASSRRRTRSHRSGGPTAPPWSTPATPSWSGGPNAPGSPGSCSPACRRPRWTRRCRSRASKRRTERLLAASRLSWLSLRMPPFSEVWLALVGSEIPLRGEERTTLARAYPTLRRFRRAHRPHRRATRGHGRARPVVGPAGVPLGRTTPPPASRQRSGPDTGDGPVDLGGPESLSWADVAAIYARVLDRRVRVLSQPAARLRRRPASPDTVRTGAGRRHGPQPADRHVGDRLGTPRTRQPASASDRCARSRRSSARRWLCRRSGDARVVRQLEVGLVELLDVDVLERQHPHVAARSGPGGTCPTPRRRSSFSSK